MQTAKGEVMHHPARHWTVLQDGRIQCDICPRLCRLHEDQRGLCFVRQAHAGSLVLTTYGRSSGFCIDPIEKKPLNHFLPGTPVLSFGTAGCNLTCRFCQNWDISKSREFDRLTELATPDSIAKSAKMHGCRSVAYTYNDPVIFLEYAVDIAEACRRYGILSVAVTAGYLLPAARKEFFQWMDGANIDLKAFTDDFYRKICGGTLKPVLETLEYLKHETDVWFELTTLLIPGHNDESTELESMCRWIYQHLGPDVPLHFSAFHPDWKMMSIPRTPHQVLQRARKIAKDNGIRHVYLGNVHDKQASSTYCHACGNLLIGRDWYELSEWGLTEDGMCGACRTLCPGFFEKLPGTWGAKRQPIRPM